MASMAPYFYGVSQALGPFLNKLILRKKLSSNSLQIYIWSLFLK